MYDVIVVGARCAGAPTAMLLARQGLRVLVVDRAGFPSDRMSTHYLQQHGLARLQRWGLLGRLLATGLPPITITSWKFEDILVRGFTPPVHGIGPAYAPRRTVLDTLLVDASREAGVEIRERFTVTGLVFDGERVRGIRGRENGGQQVEERAALVVGADGRDSFVADAVGAPVYEARPAVSCCYYSYWSGVELGFRSYLGDRQQIGLWPTHDGAHLISVMRTHDFYPEFRRDVEGNFWQVIDHLAPDVAEQMRTTGQREERFFGTGDLENFYRKPYGQGWALVGDAGYHKDPLTGQGISDAFRDAELLAGAVVAGLGGSADLNQTLAEYERARNAATSGIYDFSCAAGELDPSPDQLEILRALQHDQRQADRFFGILSGAVTVEDFFSPENLAELVGGTVLVQG